MMSEKAFAVDRPSCLRCGLNADGLATERVEDMPIRRITRQRHGDAITRLKSGEERENETGRRAGGDHNALRSDIETVPLAIGA